MTDCELVGVSFADYPVDTTEPTERRSFVRYIGTVYDIATGENINDQVAAFLTGHPEWGSGI